MSGDRYRCTAEVDVVEIAAADSMSANGESSQTIILNGRAAAMPAFGRSASLVVTLGPVSPSCQFKHQTKPK
jgi:hypothetical protein